MKKINVFGVKFSDVDDETLQEILTKNIEGANNFKIVTPNPEIVMSACKDESLKNLINNSDLVLKDGIGIVIAQKVAKINANGRQTGFDTLTKILKIANDRNLKIYIVGAKQEVLDKAISNINKDYPNIKIAGSHNGYFELDTDKEVEIINDIRQTEPDVVVSAMGFPKQELFISKLGSLTSMSIGVGGSLDVISGNLKRAPRWIQKIGMEWLYRLIKEPSRIKRQLVIPKFLLKVITHKKNIREEL